MQSPLSHYAMLARRWAWLIVLGIVICGSATYIVSKRMAPVYRASSILIINIQSSPSAFDNISASQLAAATYAQLLTSPEILRPVLAGHPGLTIQQLTSMVDAKAQPNTSLIELDVDTSKPELAAQLANAIAENFSDYANNQLYHASSQPTGSVRIIPASIPTNPLKPQPRTDAGIGALVGLVLAVGLVIIFEWVDDRLKRPEEVQEVLDLETLAVIPKSSRLRQERKTEDSPVLAEKYRTLCAHIEVAQTNKPFKLVMVTSAMAGEGRSSTAANLATFLAKMGKRVLLVDADLRHPTLEQRFRLKDGKQATGNLYGAWEQLDGKRDGQETDIPTLRVLTVGVHSNRPTELLQSPLTNRLFEHFSRASYDYIIFDSSPLLPVADAQILASYVQAAVLVVDASKTSRKALLRAKRALNRTQTTILGVVVNKSRWPDDDDTLAYVSVTRRFRSRVAVPHTPAVESDTTNTLAETPVPAEEEGADAVRPQMQSALIRPLKMQGKEEGADAVRPQTNSEDAGENHATKTTILRRQRGVGDSG
jgi:succinoglycan biosynthesis transport protein ExoP